VTRAVIWFRRDLRLSDNPALVAAARHAGPDGEVVALFCRDPFLERSSGAPRRAFLAGCVAALDHELGGRLVVRAGRPDDIVPEVATAAGASAVFIAEDFGPYGRRRDRRVARELERRDVPLRRVGSPYAVPPGEVLTQAAEPFKVFTPFSRAWRARGWPRPLRAPGRVRWAGGFEGDGLPDVPTTGRDLPEAGERAAKAAARRFFDRPLDRYADDRDRPDLDATSRLSPYLKWGCIHPRQLLAKLGRGAAHEAFRSELCWREFYADVLWHRPDTVRQAFIPAVRRMEVDVGSEADAAFDAWAEGRTGYPIVDAGMRQLAAQGWMHNRVRMTVASFLVKDLHVDWSRGARYFMTHLVDGDLASNHHGCGWQERAPTQPRTSVCSIR
jgi:deoxyribodipyrimidine photo-lyase